MKTIKCKITNEIDVSDYIRKYNSVLHISYNAFKDGSSQSEIKKIINPKFKGLNSFIIQNAIIQAQGMFKSFDTRSKDFELKNPNKKFKSLIFGGRNNLKQYLNGKITKSEFKSKRYIPISIAGETRHKGNRLFNLDFENDRAEFKPNRGTKISIEFKASNKQKAELLLLQDKCDLKEFSVAISLDNNYISFCFDEEKLNQDKKFFKKLKTNRILGIDQNPNYLGLSILEFDKTNNFKVIHKQIFDISKLTKNQTNLAIVQNQSI